MWNDLFQTNKHALIINKKILEHKLNQILTKDKTQKNKTKSC